MLFSIFCGVVCMCVCVVVCVCAGFGATYTTILTMSFSGMCCQNAYPSRTIELHYACLTTPWIRCARVWVPKWPDSGPDVCPIENMWHVMRHIIRQLRWDWDCWATTDIYDIHIRAWTCAKQADDNRQESGLFLHPVEPWSSFICSEKASTATTGFYANGYFYISGQDVQDIHESPIDCTGLSLNQGWPRAISVDTKRYLCLFGQGHMTKRLRNELGREHAGDTLAYNTVMPPQVYFDVDRALEPHTFPHIMLNNYSIFPKLHLICPSKARVCGPVSLYWLDWYDDIRNIKIMCVTKNLFIFGHF